MKLLKNAIALAALVASLAVPALATAGPFIPPGNSAATQYTETFPTSGGNVEVNRPHRRWRGRSPSKVLGPKTAHALESQGNEGAAVAALATESAGSGVGSAAAAIPTVVAQGLAKRSGGGQSGGAGGSGGNGGGSGGAAANQQPAGSSGLGQVVSHATFSTSGEMGIFLPLALLAALVWALAYTWRRRQQHLAG